MFFNYQQDEGGLQCKNCGVDIELWQYRRLALCEACEAARVAVVQGSPEVRAQRALDAYGPDWDDAFLYELNRWDEERGRLR